MSRIPIPKARLDAGRATRAQSVEVGGLNGAVSRFGQTITQIGVDLENERSQRELAQFRIDATRRLAENRQTFERESDPDAIAGGFQPAVKAIGEELLSTISDRSRRDAQLTFEALSTPHTIAIGARENNLRSEARISLANDQRRTLVSAAAAAGDAETETANLDQYAATLEGMVARGDLEEAEAFDSIKEAQREAQGAYAIRLLTDDPQALLSQIDGDRFTALQAGERARLRARATSAVKSAAASAEAEAERQAKEAFVLAGRRLTDIASVASSDRVSTDEEFLQSDEAKAHPDYAKAVSAVALRVQKPGFAALTPEKMRTAIAAEKKRGISKNFEDNALQAMEATLAAAERAWADDPIAHAASVFSGRPGARLPEPMPEIGAASDQDIADWLVGRSAYGQSLTEAGYTEADAFFTKDERGQLSAAAAANQPPEQRARLAGLIARIMPGEAGVRAVREIGGDEMTVFTGSLLAMGGSPETAMAIFEGQDALAAGNVSLGKAVDRNAIVKGLMVEGGFTEAATPEMIGAIRQAADAIYASAGFGANPTEDPDDFAEAYSSALNQALGASRGRGGVQEVDVGATGQILLPPGLSADDVEAAFAKASDDLGVRERVRVGASRGLKVVEREPSYDIWRRASKTGGLPEMNGSLITPETLDEVVLRVRGNDLYSMQINRRGVFYDLTDSETGDAYTFSLARLAGEARP